MRQAATTTRAHDDDRHRDLSQMLGIGSLRYGLIAFDGEWCQQCDGAGLVCEHCGGMISGIPDHGSDCQPGT